MKERQAKYIHYGEEELAADEYFQQWVLFPDQKNKNFWALFQETYPDQVNKVGNAYKLVQQLGNKKNNARSLSAHEKKFLKSIIYRELGFPDPIEPHVKKNLANSRKWRAVALAAAIFFFSVQFWGSRNKQKALAIITEQTKPKEIKEIVLPDSSVITLNGRSSIQYNENFLALPVREITLAGNAYFNVRKKTNQTPFIIHTNELEIAVTGTEFNVDAHSKATDIVLTRGNINVSLKNNESKKVHMEAGQALRLDTLNHDFITSTADIDLYIAAWKNREWHFQETTLETIAVYLKEYYGVDVLFKDDRLRKLMITAVVSVNDFQTLISILEKTLNINIQVNNQQLIIH
jgi:transmembrane sensor